MQKNAYENCRQARFHRLKVLESSDTQQVERCSECGDTLVFYSDDGHMVDDRSYFLAHIRDFAQPIPQDPDMFEVFTFCHPDLAKRIELEAKEKAKEGEWQKEMSESFRSALSLALKDKDWKHIDSRGVDRSSQNNKTRKL